MNRRFGRDKSRPYKKGLRIHSIFERMSRSLWLAILIALVIASIPSVAAILSTPAGGSWTGILSRNTADVNGYLSMIEEARQGSWRMRNLFTAEPHDSFQIRPLWLSIGLIGRALSGVSNVALMEAARFPIAFCLLLTISFFATRLFSTPREQFVSFFVMVFGSGLGWMRLVADPPDLRIVETSTFLTLISPPLYALSLTLVLLILFCVERVWNSDHPFKYSIAAGFFALWLGFDRPFSAITLAFTLTIFMTIEWSSNRHNFVERWKLLAPIGFGLGISILYQFLSIRSVPVYSQWNRQHVLPTPSWAQLLTSLGFLIPLALLGAGHFFRANRVLAICVGAFVICSWFFSHLPFGFQERFLEGLPVMISMFAAFGLIRLLRPISTATLYTSAVTIAILILGLSHFFAIRADLSAIARQSPPQYMPRVVLDAMRKMKSLAAPGEAILSTEPTGNFLIAYSGRPVVVGQKIQTANYPEKWRLVNQYLSTPANDPRSRELFIESHATWLFWGPEEAGMSRGRFHPAQTDYLVEKYNNGFIRLFKLK